MSDHSFKSQAKLDRRMCQRSLYYLCKEVLGYKDLVPHVHGELCYFATSPEYGRFRQATMPRSWFKTWVWTVGKSIWLSLPDEEELFKEIYPYKGPDARILIASNVIDNAAKMVFKIKQEWMHNERLKAAFPELIPDFNKTRWSDHVAQIKRSLNATEGTYTAVGVGGSVISQHFDHIMEDDLIYARKDDFTGRELMPSQEDIDNAIGWHKLAYSLLSNPQTSCIDNVGTRWAPMDLIWYLRKFEKTYRCFEIAVTEKIDKQAVWPIEDNRYCVWPERYDCKTLKQIEEAQGPRMFETQYLNRPKASVDVVFKKEYVNIHDSFDEYPTDMQWKTIVDLAGWDDKKGLARNVILTGGMDKKHHLWIARLDVGRLNPSQVIALFKSHAKQFNSWVNIEEIQYQRALRHFAKEMMEADGEWYHVEQLKYDGRKNAKDLRIQSIEPVVSNGALHILPSMMALLEELEMYPNTPTKDILDCLGYLYRIVKPSGEASTEVADNNPFLVENIENEIKSRCTGDYPFDVQLSKSANV